MKFWNNPEYNSIKALLIVVVIAAAAYFVFNSMHSNSLAGRGQVVETPAVAQGGLIFSQENNQNTCVLTVYSAKDQSQNISVNGTLASNGDCIPNNQQGNQVSQGLADAWKGTGVATQQASAPTSPSVIFSETTNGNTCTLTLTSSTNQTESVSLVGTLSKNGDCAPNVKQPNPAAQGMVDAMGTSGTKVVQ